MGEFWHITLPLLKPTTLLVMVMNVIVAMKVFAVPLIMTGGGPADSTRVLPLFIYQTAFEFFDMGRAAAMSVFLFVAVMLFSFIQIRLFSRGEDSDDGFCRTDREQADDGVRDGSEAKNSAGRVAPAGDASPRQHRRILRIARRGVHRPAALLLDALVVAARRWRTCSASRSSGFPTR